MAGPDVTVVIPVFNDLHALEIAVPRSIEILSRITSGFELIIAEDGSTDGSADFVRQYELRDPRIHLLHSDERLGRGKALNRAIYESKANIVCYYDVDLATDLQHLPELIGSIREGADIATGSRLMPGSDTLRTGGREIASRTYNFLVRFFLGSRIYDHQCGFKSFKREPLLGLLGEVEATHWFWDTEIMVRAHQHGYKIKEFPVEWKSGKDTKVNLAKDSWNMFWQIMGLWWNLKIRRK